MHRFTGDDAGSFEFDLAKILGINFALAVDGNADAVHHPTDKAFADRNLYDSLGTLDGVAFFDFVGLAENRSADVIFFEIEHHAHDAAREFQQFAGHGLVQTVNAGNTVTNGNDGTGFADFDFATEILYLFFDDRADFFCSDFHKTFSPLL